MDDADEPKLQVLAGGAAPRRVTYYKVVETQTVTDETLERIINEWVRQGWVYDGVQFAMRDSSKRPAMAFLIFTRQDVVEADG